MTCLSWPSWYQSITRLSAVSSGSHGHPGKRNSTACGENHNGSAGHIDMTSQRRQLSRQLQRQATGNIQSGFYRTQSPPGPARTATTMPATSRSMSTHFTSTSELKIQQGNTCVILQARANNLESLPSHVFRPQSHLTWSVMPRSSYDRFRQDVLRVAFISPTSSRRESYT